MSEQVAEAEATEGFASTAEAAAGAAEAAAAAEGPGALALFGEAALGTAAGMGAAAGGLAVAGGAAALVGTAWALHGGMVAAEHLLGWGGGGGSDTDASRPRSAPDIQTLNGMQEFGAEQHFQRGRRSTALTRKASPSRGPSRPRGCRLVPRGPHVSPQA